MKFSFSARRSGERLGPLFLNFVDPPLDILIVTAKILRLRLTQKLNNHRGSDVRGDRQFELSLQND